MKIAKILCAAMVVLIAGPVLPATDNEYGHEYEMIVLTDSRNEHRLPAEVAKLNKSDRKRREMLGEREKSRHRHLDELRRTIQDMEANGFTIAEDSEISTYDELIAELRRLPRNDALARSAEIEPGFQPADLSRTVFSQGRLLGRVSLYDDGGRSHDLATAYEFDELGVVIVEELSFATIPNVRITVNKPVGNLRVNGHAATYTALTNPDGTKGLSSITFITESKLITVTALMCITRSDETRFRQFVELAGAVS